MSDQFQNSLPDPKDLLIRTLFVDSLDHKHRESVVKHALASRAKVGSEIQKSLNAVIDGSINAPSGFRTASTAPDSLIVSPILRQVHYSSSLVTAILKTWVAASGDIHDAVVDCLKSIGIPSDYPDFGSHQFRTRQPNGVLLNALDSIIQAHSRFDHKDVFLMLCYVSGAVPASPKVDDRRREKGEAHSILSQTLQYLRDLPANSSAWEDSVPDFQESIVRITIEKKDERDDEAHREGLRVAIAEIKEHDSAEYWGLDKHEWSVLGNISSSGVSECLGLLQELESAFGEYVSIPDKGTSRNQTLAFQQRQSEVEAKIDPIKSKLDRILTPVDHPTDGLPHDHAPSSSESEPNTSNADEGEVVSGTHETAIEAKPILEPARDRDTESSEGIAGEEPVSSTSEVRINVDADLDQETTSREHVTPATSDERLETVEEASPSLSDDSDASTDTGISNTLATVSPVDLSNTEGTAVPTEKAAYPDNDEDDLEIDHNELIWSLVGEDDLAGAYWIAQSLEERGLNPYVPPDLLKAVQGARWLSPFSETYLGELSAIVSQSTSVDHDFAQTLLRLAAALKTSIMASGANMLEWLSVPDSCGRLEPLVAPIRESANLGIDIMPQDVSADKGKQQLDDLILQASLNAKKWLDEDARTRRHSFQRANEIWHSLLSSGTPLLNILTPVFSDRRQEVDSVRRAVTRLKDTQSSVADMITQIDRQLLGNNMGRRKITSHAMSWLTRGVEDAVSLSEHWCELVERELHTDNAAGAWRAGQIAKLRTGVSSTQVAAFNILDELTLESSPAEVKAAAKCLTRALQHLLDYLGIPYEQRHGVSHRSAVSDLGQINDPDVNPSTGDNQHDALEVAMARRLIWISPKVLDDSGLPVTERLGGLIQSGLERFSNDLPLDDLLTEQMNGNDFRFFDVLVLALNQSSKVALLEQYNRDLDEAQKSLSAAVEDAKTMIETLANDTAIEYEGDDWDELMDPIKDIEHIEPREVLNVAKHLDVLTGIHERIRTHHASRRDSLVCDWQQTLKSIRDEARNPEIIGILERRFKREPLDLRVMASCLDDLRSHSGNAPLSVADVQRGGDRRTLENFIEHLQQA